jgi:hypothetical protein
VKEPTVDDENKLTRVIRYLQSSKGLVLRLRADNLNIVKWWIDASYAVHKDMKSHTGGVMYMGLGTAKSSLQKQKLNTKSSTEAELVGVADILPQVLWTRCFLEAQGYGTKSVLHQDNQASIRMEENGNASIGRRTRHINIRYFFIANGVAKKEVSIMYCPTKLMVADCFTKPLQGSLFYKFRDQILGVVPMDDLNADHRSVLDGKVPPKMITSSKRKISCVAKMKKTNVKHGKMTESSLGREE